MIVYGRNPVREALRGRRAVGTVWATERAADEPWLRDVDVLEASPAELEQRAGTAAHQGICAEAAPYPYADEYELFRAGAAPFIVALDEIQDPQNLGAICRTAECAGVDGVVIPERRAAEVTSAVCKASAGAVEHLRVARVRNIADFLGAAKTAGCWCYGADAGGGRPYTEVEWAGDGLVLVIGAEGRGLRPRVAAACDGLVSIPLTGRVRSLNASAAAAVLVFAALTARHNCATLPPA